MDFKKQGLGYILILSFKKDKGGCRGLMVYANLSDQSARDLAKGWKATIGNRGVNTWLGSTGFGEAQLCFSTSFPPTEWLVNTKKWEGRDYFVRLERYKYLGEKPMDFPEEKVGRLWLEADGFTLVELSVVIIIIGVLAAFAVPKFRDAVERAKSAEAFNYLTSICAAQERYHVRQGTYAPSVTMLDIVFNKLKYFNVGDIQPGPTGNLEDSWSQTLTRFGASAGYGFYTVTFTEDGFESDVTKSTIAALASINPMST